jgi:hypothetical protein
VDLKENDVANSVVIEDPNAKVNGETIAEWTRDWLKWQLQAPADQNPASSASYEATHYHNDGQIFFLAGGPGGQVIDVPSGKALLLPMINAWDTEGPGIETIRNYHDSGRGSYADEARYITGLVQGSIYDAFLTITKVGETTPLVDLHWPGSSAYAEDTGTFALGKPRDGSLIQSLTGTLDPSIKSLPFTEEVGRWALIDGLSPGDYTISFGGAGHKVIDSVTGQTLFDEGWGVHTSETLHIA